MLKLLSTLSLLASIFYLYVGIYTYRLNKSSRVCKIFLLLNSAMFIWSFAYSFAYTAQNVIIFSFWNKVSALGWCTFSALILYLVLAITESRLLNYLFVRVLILLPAPIFLFTTLFLFGPYIKTNKTVALFFYKGNFIYNFSYLLLSIIIIDFWGKNSESSAQKRQAKIIVITSLMPFMLDLITQTVLPSLGLHKIPGMGQIYSLIMLWGVYYVIVHYGFMQIPTSLITKELFSEMIDLAFLVDLKGNIIKANKQVHHLLQYDELELLNTPISLIIKEKSLSSLLNDCDHFIETVRFNDMAIASKSKIIIPFNLSLTPLRDSKTHMLLGTLIVGQDIRSIKALQNEIERHKSTSEKLKKSEELFRTMVETIPFAIILTNAKDNTILYINHESEELFHVKRSDTIGESVSDYYNNPNERAHLISEIKQGVSIKEREISFKRKDHSIILGLITMIPTIYQEQEVLLVCVGDITEQKKLQQAIVNSEEMLRKLMYAIPDAVIVTDLCNKITFVNNSAYSILGYTDEKSLLSTDILSLLSVDDKKRAQAHIQKMFTGCSTPQEYLHIINDGTTFDGEVNGTILRDESGSPFGAVYVSRDITERKKGEEKLKQINAEIERVNNELLSTNRMLKEKSIRDSLTNLYNHQYINELLEAKIQKTAACACGLCLMMLDIDFFKHVNDNFGHQVGDKVLVTAAHLIESNVRNIDLIGRYGGEEFIVILPTINLKAAYAIADKIRLSIQDFDFGMSGLKVTISIGLAEFQSEDAKLLVNRADTLLYLAKDNGRNRIET